MDKKRYLITQSLLSAWLYQYNCAEGQEDESRDSFLKTLRRERCEQSPAMLRGIEFEDAVQSTIAGDTEAAGEYVKRWGKRGYNDEERACIESMAKIMRGGTYQLTAYKDKTIAGIPFLLMAKCDWVKSGIIYDCKRVENYEVGKYYDSPQHPMYLGVIDGAKEFRYEICDGTDVYTERYTRGDIPQNIEDMIAEFAESLKSDGLWGIYAEKWQTK